jgi:hypothetical protein
MHKVVLEQIANIPEEAWEGVEDCPDTPLSQPRSVAETCPHYAVEQSGRRAVRFAAMNNARVTIIERPVDCYVIRPRGPRFEQRVSRRWTDRGTAGRWEVDYDGDPPPTGSLAR